MVILSDALEDFCLLTPQERDDFLISYRACDSSPVCRRVLLSHPEGPLRPQHLQSDILERVHPTAVAKMKALLSRQVTHFNLAAKRLNKKGKTNLKKTLGRKFLAQCCRVMKGVGHAGLKKKCACSIHHTDCYVHPPAEVRGNRKYLITAGHVCKPWSTMGKGMGWLDLQTIVFVVFFFDAAAADPDYLILECTGGVDIEGYCLINEAAGAAERKKTKIIKNKNK